MGSLDEFFGSIMKDLALSGAGASAGSVIGGPIGAIVGAVAGGVTGLADNPITGKGVVTSGQQVANNPNNRTNEEMAQDQQAAAIAKANQQNATAPINPGGKPSKGLDGGENPNAPTTATNTFNNIFNANGAGTPVSSQMAQVQAPQQQDMTMSDRRNKQNIKPAELTLRNFLTQINNRTI